MNKTRTLSPSVGVLFSLLAAASYAGEWNSATRNIDQHQLADPKGTVEIVNVAGSVQVNGWEKAEVSVNGQIGERVEKVEVTGSGSRTTVRVILPSGSSWGGDGSARLVIHVPMASALDISLVSADLDVAGVNGAQRIRTVSGEVHSAGGGAAHVNTVSGDIHISVTNDTPAQIETVSGEVSVQGAGGAVSVQTVSGDGHLTLGTLGNFQMRTVSGDFGVTARLGAGANFEGESVSGDMNVSLKDSPGAQYDLQTLSGDIDSCGGKEPVHATYGPGTRLNFTAGDGKSQVHLSSKSGDLGLCGK